MASTKDTENNILLMVLKPIFIFKSFNWVFVFFKLYLKSFIASLKGENKIFYIFYVLVTLTVKKQLGEKGVLQTF